MIRAMCGAHLFAGGHSAGSHIAEVMVSASVVMRVKHCKRPRRAVQISLLAWLPAHCALCMRYGALWAGCTLHIAPCPERCRSCHPCCTAPSAPPVRHVTVLGMVWHPPPKAPPPQGFAALAPFRTPIPPSPGPPPPRLCAPQAEYKKMYEVLYWHVVPGGTARECRALTEAEWKAEGSAKGLTFERFFHMIYTLVDIWCEGVPVPCGVPREFRSRGGPSVPRIVPLGRAWRATQGSIRMAVHRRWRGGYPSPWTPPPRPKWSGVHYLWFAFVCFLIRSHPPRPKGPSWGKPKFTIGKIWPGHFWYTKF